MFRSLLKRLVKRIIGQKPPPPTPQKRYEPPPPPQWMSQEHEHSHEHTHGHSHEHHHTHAADPEEKTEPSKSQQTADERNPVDVIPIETPNPNAYKFSISQKITEKSFSASSTDEAAGNAIAEALIAQSSIASVFGVNDFVTVTKHPDASWDNIIPDVVEILQQLA